MRAPETLRAFAYKFLERGTGGIDSHHDHGTVGAIVESWITREDSAQYPALVWVVTVKVLKETTRQELRDGKLKGFSIEFTGKYREKTLVVTGVGKVRTGEILDPYPLTLSLVKAPAIGILFEGVEARGLARQPGAQGGEVVEGRGEHLGGLAEARPGAGDRGRVVEGDDHPGEL